MKSLETMSRSELEAVIAEANRLLFPMLKEAKTNEREQREKKRKSAAERKKELEREALELYETVEVGDYVRVDGVRDNRYTWREVTSLDGGITGWQVAPVKLYNAKKERWERGYYNKSLRGVEDLSTVTWTKGKEHTQHMANKIRQVVKKKDIT